MMQSFVLPDLGENIDAVDVSAVLVAKGDTVRKDQPVLEVETEKASLEVPVPYDGVVVDVLVTDGAKVRIGDPVLTIDSAVEVASASAEPAEPEPAASTGDGGASTETPVAPAPEETPAVTKPAVPRSEASTSVARVDASSPSAARPLADPIPASPSVRRLAREIGVDLAAVDGSGPGGRISRDDVKTHAKSMLTGGATAVSASATALPDPERFGPVRREAIGNVRKATAANLARAWSTIPAVTQFDHADVTELEVLRKKWSKRPSLDGNKLTVTAILLKVAASALHRFPRFNAALDLQRGELVYREYVHLGVA
ncbi:MAG: 2-oxo acid dehydrogenase subunit E2, partial [Planctomycetota bacterium]|nr:2-oxo acid dehydrogenase subunit E2 [Planctomycetota bacterium]